MTSAHRRLRRRLYDAVPVDWHARTEGCGHWIDPSATWRADVLVAKGRCTVALEAQLQTGALYARSDARLRSGVWPLWVFARLIERLRDEPVISVDELHLIPRILESLHELPPLNRLLCWGDVRSPLKCVLAIARAGLAKPEPEP